jgi:hypothetical protein
MENEPSFRKGECIDAERKFPEGERVGPTGSSGLRTQSQEQFMDSSMSKSRNNGRVVETTRVSDLGRGLQGEEEKGEKEY